MKAHPHPSLPRDAHGRIVMTWGRYADLARLWPASQALATGYLGASEAPSLVRETIMAGTRVADTLALAVLAMLVAGGVLLVAQCFVPRFRASRWSHLPILAVGIGHLMIAGVAGTNGVLNVVVVLYLVFAGLCIYGAVAASESS